MVTAIIAAARWKDERKKVLTALTALPEGHRTAALGWALTRPQRDRGVRGTASQDPCATQLLLHVVRVAQEPK